MMSSGSVSGEYDKWAPHYDASENKTRDLDRKAFAAQKFDIAGKDVVEFGCGTGHHTVWLREAASGDPKSYTGFDVSPEMMAIAKAKMAAAFPAAEVSFMRHDIRRTWPLGDASADLAFGNLVLEHVDDLESFFVQAGRVVRPGGTLYLCEFHPFRQYEGKVAHLKCPSTGEAIAFPPCFRHDVSEYVSGGMGAAGMELVSLQEWKDDDSREDRVPRVISLRFKKKKKEE